MWKLLDMVEKIVHDKDTGCASSPRLVSFLQWFDGMRSDKVLSMLALDEPLVSMFGGRVLAKFPLPVPSNGDKCAQDN